LNRHRIVQLKGSQDRHFLRENCRFSPPPRGNGRSRAVAVPQRTSVVRLAGRARKSGLSWRGRCPRLANDSTSAGTSGTTRVPREEVATDTNLHDALPLGKVESSAMRSRKKLRDALSVRNFRNCQAKSICRLTPRLQRPAQRVRCNRGLGAIP